jgi:hypothetical protein
VRVRLVVDMEESEGHTYLFVRDLFVDVNTGSERKEKTKMRSREELRGYQALW